MRRCLSFFMVVLLVLRGLVGDAMSMELMLPITPAISLNAQVTAEATTHEHHVDSAFQPADAHCMPSFSAEHCQHDTDGDTCSSCVLCHSAWSVQSTHISLAGLEHRELPAHFAATPISAPISNLIKPPIVGA